MCVLIWKGPALLILLVCFAVAYGIVSVMPAVDEPTRMASGTVIGGLATLSVDLVYRRKQGLKPFDLSRSTVFFIVPTWTFGLWWTILALINLCGGTALG